MGSQRDGCNFVTKQQQSEDLLYSTGNSTQHSATTHLGKESKKRVDICMCVADSLGCTPKANTTLSINYTPIKFFFKVIKIKTLLTVKTTTGHHFKPTRMAKMKCTTLSVGKDM